MHGANKTEQRKCEKKAALPSSWARRLFIGDPEMAEDGRRHDCKRIHIYDCWWVGTASWDSWEPLFRDSVRGVTCSRILVV
jgi:hypothetical protein